MVFSSLIFLFVFLPVFLLVYFLSPTKFKNLTLLIFSYIFYAWGAPQVVVLLLLSSLLDYWVSIKITAGSPRKKTWLVVGLVANLAALGYYKYANFFVAEVNRLFADPVTWTEIALPIGISFFTFQKISFLLDIWSGRANKPSSFVNYALFVVCFPQLIAGPIVRFHIIAAELEKRRHTLDNIYQGACRFIFGLGKKVLIANPLGEVADTVFALEVSTVPAGFAWFGIVCYALQIYFDFSGYSDMAIGLGKMMGFTFPENFNHPYISKNISEFWRRWHMTLGQWMKLYLYIPLGGNRCSKARMFFNLWVVFLLSGLWHGAAWTFVIWGAFHGLFLVLDRLFWIELSQKLPAALNIGITFFIVLIGWVFFRATSFEHAIGYLTQMFEFSSLFQAHETLVFANLANSRTMLFFTVGLAFSFLPAVKFNFEEKETNFGLFGQSAAAVVVLLFTAFNLTNASFNPFIYFRF